MIDLDTIVQELSRIEHSGSYGFNDNAMMNKPMKYHVEFSIEVESIDDLSSIVNNDLNGFYVKIMTTPNSWDGNQEALIRVDFETIEQIEDFADLVYDLELIDDSEYENFEDFIDVN
jgi:hypothetical protein